MMIPGAMTVHCSVDNLELFSCIVSNEDDTALSILDPVSIGIELKPMELGIDNEGSHLLEVCPFNNHDNYNNIFISMIILLIFFLCYSLM